ncbi:MAG: response regulator [Clostridia bacterium]|jgi:YesN/AraC family two-component response regulator|nr:response regulator [Clostridia bacterium]
MPLKLVIVEDNPLTVRSLTETIDWTQLDCEVVGTAGDGETGRDMILDKMPDIVLTDIRMPQCSGLDMLETIRDKIPDCKVIIITGYDHFQYASRAIKLAVFDYLLKPIRNEEVIASVQRAAAEIRRRQEAQRSLAEADAVHRRAQLVSLLTNPSQRGQGVRAVFDSLDLHFAEYYIMTVRLSEAGEISQSALNHLDQLIASRRVSAVTFFLYDTMVAFIMRQTSDDGWKRESLELAEAIAEGMTEPVEIGVSRRNTSLHAIRTVYQQARQAMWEAALTRDECAVVFFEEGDHREHASPKIAEFNRRVSDLIEKAELSDECARDAARELVALSGNQYSQLRALIAMYSLELRRKFGASSNLQTDAALYESWFVTSPEEAEACLLKMCALLRSGAQEERYSLLTRNTIQYINLHAADSLHLNDVAEHMNVSGNYLSALIRKETGITFHDHVLKAKMAVARTMLADPRILVEEVARAVGYSNYISFYNAFKRTENMTPSDYRNRKVTL